MWKCQTFILLMKSFIFNFTLLILPFQDTNPIFLFSKTTIESAVPPSPSVNYGSGTVRLKLRTNYSKYLNLGLDLLLCSHSIQSFVFKLVCLIIWKFLRVWQKSLDYINNETPKISDVQEKSLVAKQHAFSDEIHGVLKSLKFSVRLEWMYKSLRNLVYLIVLYSTHSNLTFSLLTAVVFAFAANPDHDQPAYLFPM